MSNIFISSRSDYLVATELNNIGVELLEAGSFRRAMQTLKEAIEVMKVALRPVPSNLDYRSSNDAGTNIDIRIFKAKRRLEELEFSYPTSNAFLYKTGEGFINQYLDERDREISQDQQNPIFIQVSDLNEFECINPDVESAVIFYNLALVHLQMSAEALNGSIFVQGAHDLFDMAYSIALSDTTTIMDMSLEDIRELNQTRVLFAIVILNNMIRVKRALGKHDDARNAMQRLIRLGLAVNNPEGNPDYVNVSSAAPAA